MKTPLPLVASLPLFITMGCAAPVVSVEVLPPRTGVSCSTPGTEGPALGRGLYDAQATEAGHGAYLADLRLVVSGANAHVDGVDVRVTRDGDEVELIEDVPTGDVLLVGEGDDVRKGVLENVELLPRSIGVQLRGADDVTAVELATLVLEISPRVGPELVPLSSTFALNVCNGCLVAKPTTDECPGGATQNAVCRVGQDAELFSCAAVAQ